MQKNERGFQLLNRTITVEMSQNIKISVSDKKISIFIDNFAVIIIYLIYMFN